jgi:hypothetical protein
MPLLELDEDALKLIAAKVCSVDTKTAKRGMHSVMRVDMPCLSLRETSRVFRLLAPHEQLRAKIHDDLEWFRSFFISNAVLSVLNAIADGPAGAAVQMHTLEKDGILFHIQLHTDAANVLYQAHEMIAKRNGNTTRTGMLQGLDMPPEYAVVRARRTPKQQEDLVEWCEKIRNEMLLKWANIFANLHSDMAAKKMRMFQDLA